ncbi:MAG: FtsW/RodA/SpoVE family cell cycle protein [Adlercreutzia equolifaciens]
MAAGAVVMIVLWRFDYRRLFEFTTLFLIVNVVLILLPHIPGLGTDAGMGAKSWIKIGMQVQPGEFAKVTVVLFAASLLARYQGTLDDWREYCKVLGCCSFRSLAIMTQPDWARGWCIWPSRRWCSSWEAPEALPAHHAYRRHRGHRVMFAVELLKYQQSDGTWEHLL